jgi:ABC-type phosphate transport system substrate-binding protein
MKKGSTNMRSLTIGGLVLATALAASLADAGDIVVVMAPGAAALSKDQVGNVYLGRSTDFAPIDLPESSPVREAFYKKAADRDAAQVKAVWARITFTGQGKPPKEMPDAAAVKKAVAADPKAIGYIDKADADASVKIVLALP